MRVFTVVCAAMVLTAAVRAEPVLRNGDFQIGGHTWAAAWRPLPGDTRIRRVTEGERAYLHLKLRRDADGGVVQRVELPAGAAFSLRMLATAWDTPSGGVVGSLVRCSDGVVLCEIVVDGIKRGEVAANFRTARPGPEVGRHLT
ncbi:MAG: hypothetical protein J7M38_03025, partial [Armatimonadetes bacterium]|nr:hypothetical protein [Armatimonadota bacterium]